MKKRKCTCGCFIWKLFKKVLGIGVAAFAVLFTVFFFDLDGKLLFYVVEPFLKKHYDNMERKDTLQSPYDTGKYQAYDYEEVYKKGQF